MLVVLLGIGGVMFNQLGDTPKSLTESIYYTWSLIFGEPPVQFPRHWALEALFFVVPVIGLTVVLEGLIEFALLLRDRRRSEKEWCRAMCKILHDHVVLVGLGRLGYRVYQLLRRLGIDVVVIEVDEKNQFLEDVRRDGSPLFIGDGRREALLGDANLAYARSIVLASSNDLANLEIALDAKRIRPDIRVIVRMFDQNMADKIADGFNIRLALSQSAISAPAFAAAALDPDVVNTTVIAGRLVVVKRWTVDPGGPLAGKTVGQLMDAHEVAVIERTPAHELDEHRLFPPTYIELKPGDELLVQGPMEELVRLRGTEEEARRHEGT